MSDYHTSRPGALDVNPEGIPDLLKQTDNWLIWRHIWNEDREEWAKIPKDGAGSGYNIDATDPKNGVSFETALENYLSGDYDGVGIITDPALPVGLDLDDCRDPNRSQDSVPQVVQKIVNTWESYVEISPSGTGYRGFVIGKKPAGRNKNILPCDPVIGDKTPQIEMYDGTGGRYLTVTGHHVEGTPKGIQENPNGVHEIFTKYIDHGEQASLSDNDTLELNIDPSVDDEGDLGPTERRILDRGRDATNGEKFRRLFSGDISLHGNDHSCADNALCVMMVHWTVEVFGPENVDLDDDDDVHSVAELVDRLFRQSGLMRTKWDETHYADGRTYGEGTIGTAIEQYRSNQRDTDNQPTDIPEYNALREHVDEIEDLPCPMDVAKQFKTKEGDPYEGPRALKGEKHSELGYVVWRLSSPYLTLQPLTDGSILKFENGVWIEGGEQILQETAEFALGRQCANNVITELIGRFIRTGDAIPRTEMGVPDGTIAVANGLLDLRRRELAPLEPEHHAIRQLPVEYDPEATCPRFIEFLNESVRKEDQMKLQEYAGYCLHHWGQPYKKALLLIGPTDSGKSTFLKTIRSLLGIENIASESLDSLMSTRWGTASLFGTVANIRNELTPREVNNPQRFKELTGGEDMVDAEFKGKDKFTFIVTQKFLFATNRVPNIKHRDEAFNNRWLFIDFPHTIPANQQDPHLADELGSELPGVLNWVIEGYQRLTEQSGFSHERQLGEKEALWEEHGGPINRFKHDMLEITGNPDHCEIKSKIHEVYALYCNENGEKAATQSKLTRELNTDPAITQGQRRYYDGKRQEVLYGVRFADEDLRSDPETAPDSDESESIDRYS